MTKPAVRATGADSRPLVGPVAGDRLRRWLPGAVVVLATLIVAAVLA